MSTELFEAKGSLSKLTWLGEQYFEATYSIHMKDPPAVTLDTAMTEADFSNKHLGVSGASILAAVLGCKTFRDKGSLVSLNLANNKLGVEGAKHVATGFIALKDSRALARVDLSGNNDSPSASPEFIRPIANALKTNTSITTINLSKNSLNAEAAKVLSDGIKDAKGALSKLDLSKNDLRSEGLSAVSEALKSTSIKQLNITENNLQFNTGHVRGQQARQWDMAGVIKFTGDMKDMGSLSKLTFSGTCRQSKPVTVEVGMTEADFSGAQIGESGATILVGWLEHKVQHTTQTNLD
jgi:hypothetical protein